MPSIDTSENLSERTHDRLKRLDDVVWSVRQNRSNEYWLDIGRLCGVVVLAFIITIGVMVAINPPDLGLLVQFLLFLIGSFFTMCVLAVIMFWPFLLILYANVNMTRQNTLLTILRNAYETKAPLSDVLFAYASSSMSPWYRRKIEHIAYQLEKGHSLEKVLSSSRNLVRYDMEGILKIGGGNLETLKLIDKSLNRELNQSIHQSSMIMRLCYLIAICIPTWLIYMFLMINVLPSFQYMFADMGVSLPWITDFFVRGAGTQLLMLVPLPLFFMAIYMFVFFLLDSDFVLARPVLMRKVFRSVDSARLLRVLAVGIRRETELPEVLKSYRKTIGRCEYLRNLVNRIYNAIEKGENWISYLKKEKILTANEASLLETAEQAGNLPTVLEDLAYAKEALHARRHDLWNKLLFLPAILLMSLIIGGFAIAVFMPLVKMIETMSAV